MLTGDKVKPVLLNSKLPVDVLGRVRQGTVASYNDSAMQGLKMQLFSLSFI